MTDVWRLCQRYPGRTSWSPQWIKLTVSFYRSKKWFHSSSAQKTINQTHLEVPEETFPFAVICEFEVKIAVAHLPKHESHLIKHKGLGIRRQYYLKCSKLNTDAAVPQPWNTQKALLHNGMQTHWQQKLFATCFSFILFCFFVQLLFEEGFWCVVCLHFFPQPKNPITVNHFLLFKFSSCSEREQHHTNFSIWDGAMCLWRCVWTARCYAWRCS